MFDLRPRIRGGVLARRAGKLPPLRAATWPCGCLRNRLPKIRLNPRTVELATLPASKTHFLFTIRALYRRGWLARYGDKLLRAIGTTDPGAVPGGSTITLGIFGVFDGAELGSTWAEKRSFCSG